MSTGILAVVAHPDDEALGAGGSLARLAAAGCRVDTLFLADGVESRGGDFQLARGARTQEMLAAGQRLGLRVLGLPASPLPDNAMDTVGVLPIARMVEDKLKATGAEVVYTHQPHDLNVDHRLVCQAVLTATRPYPGQQVRAVYGFEVPSSTEWTFGAFPPFVPNVFVPLSEALWAKKEAALRCYASELREFPHPRSIKGLLSLARYRGSQCGHDLAEAFTLLREVRA